MKLRRLLQLLRLSLFLILAVPACSAETISHPLLATLPQSANGAALADLDGILAESEDSALRPDPQLVARELTTAFDFLGRHELLYYDSCFKIDGQLYAPFALAQDTISHGLEKGVGRLLVGGTVHHLLIFSLYSEALQRQTRKLSTFLFTDISASEQEAAEKTLKNARRLLAINEAFGFPRLPDFRTGQSLRSKIGALLGGEAARGSSKLLSVIRISRLAYEGCFGPNTVIGNLLPLDAKRKRGDKGGEKTGDFGDPFKRLLTSCLLGLGEGTGAEGRSAPLLFRLFLKELRSPESYFHSLLDEVSIRGSGRSLGEGVFSPLPKFPKILEYLADSEEGSKIVTAATHLLLDRIERDSCLLRLLTASVEGDVEALQALRLQHSSASANTPYCVPEPKRALLKVTEISADVLDLIRKRVGEGSNVVGTKEDGEAKRIAKHEQEERGEQALGDEPEKIVDAGPKEPEPTAEKPATLSDEPISTEEGSPKKATQKGVKGEGAANEKERPKGDVLPAEGSVGEKAGHATVPIEKHAPENESERETGKASGNDFVEEPIKQADEARVKTSKDESPSEERLKKNIPKEGGANEQSPKGDSGTDESLKGDDVKDAKEAKLQDDELKAENPGDENSNKSSPKQKQGGEEGAPIPLPAPRQRKSVKAAEGGRKPDLDNPSTDKSKTPSAGGSANVDTASTAKDQPPPEKQPLSDAPSLTAAAENPVPEKPGETGTPADVADSKIAKVALGASAVAAAKDKLKSKLKPSIAATASSALKPGKTENQAFTPALSPSSSAVFVADLLDQDDFLNMRKEDLLAMVLKKQELAGEEEVRARVEEGLEKLKKEGSLLKLCLALHELSLQQSTALKAVGEKVLAENPAVRAVLNGLQKGGLERSDLQSALSAGFNDELFDSTFFGAYDLSGRPAAIGLTFSNGISAADGTPDQRATLDEEAELGEPLLAAKACAQRSRTSVCEIILNLIHTSASGTARQDVIPGARFCQRQSQSSTGKPGTTAGIKILAVSDQVPDALRSLELAVDASPAGGKDDTEASAMAKRWRTVSEKWKSIGEMCVRLQTKSKSRAAGKGESWLSLERENAKCTFYTSLSQLQNERGKQSPSRALFLASLNSALLLMRLNAADASKDGGQKRAKSGDDGGEDMSEQMARTLRDATVLLSDTKQARSLVVPHAAKFARTFEAPEGWLLNSLTNASPQALPKGGSEGVSDDVSKELMLLKEVFMVQRAAHCPYLAKLLKESASPTPLECKQSKGDDRSEIENQLRSLSASYRQQAEKESDPDRKEALSKLSRLFDPSPPAAQTTPLEPLAPEPLEQMPVKESTSVGAAALGSTPVKATRKEKGAGASPPLPAAPSMEVVEIAELKELVKNPQTAVASENAEEAEIARLTKLCHIDDSASEAHASKAAKDGAPTDGVGAPQKRPLQVLFYAAAWNSEVGESKSSSDVFRKWRQIKREGWKAACDPSTGAPAQRAEVLDSLDRIFRLRVVSSSAGKGAEGTEGTEKNILPERLEWAFENAHYYQLLRTCLERESGSEAIRKALGNQDKIGAVYSQTLSKEMVATAGELGQVFGGLASKVDEKTQAWRERIGRLSPDEFARGGGAKDALSLVVRDTADLVRSVMAQVTETASARARMRLVRRHLRRFSWHFTKFQSDLFFVRSEFGYKIPRPTHPVASLQSATVQTLLAAPASREKLPASQSKDDRAMSLTHGTRASVRLEASFLQLLNRAHALGHKAVAQTLSPVLRLYEANLDAQEALSPPGAKADRIENIMMRTAYTDFAIFWLTRYIAYFTADAVTPTDFLPTFEDVLNPLRKSPNQGARDAPRSASHLPVKYRFGMTLPAVYESVLRSSLRERSRRVAFLAEKNKLRDPYKLVHLAAVQSATLNHTLKRLDDEAAHSLSQASAGHRSRSPRGSQGGLEGQGGENDPAILELSKPFEDKLRTVWNDFRRQIFFAETHFKANHFLCHGSDLLVTELATILPPDLFFRSTSAVDDFITKILATLSHVPSTTTPENTNENSSVLASEGIATGRLARHMALTCLSLARLWGRAALPADVCPSHVLDQTLKIRRRNFPARQTQNEDTQTFAAKHTALAACDFLLQEVIEPFQASNCKRSVNSGLKEEAEGAFAQSTNILCSTPTKMAQIRGFPVQVFAAPLPPSPSPPSPPHPGKVQVPRPAPRTAAKVRTGTKKGR